MKSLILSLLFAAALWCPPPLLADASSDFWRGVTTAVINKKTYMDQGCESYYRAADAELSVFFRKVVQADTVTEDIVAYFIKESNSSVKFVVPILKENQIAIEDDVLDFKKRVDPKKAIDLKNTLFKHKEFDIGLELDKALNDLSGDDVKENTKMSFEFMNCLLISDLAKSGAGAKRYKQFIQAYDFSFAN